MKPGEDAFHEEAAFGLFAAGLAVLEVLDAEIMVGQEGVSGPEVADEVLDLGVGAGEVVPIGA